MGKAYQDSVESAARRLGVDPFRMDLDIDYNKKIKKLKNTSVDPYGEEDWGWEDTNDPEPHGIPKGHGAWIEKKYLKKI